MGVLCGGWSHGAWLHGVRPHGSRPHGRKVTKALLLPEPGDCETVTVGELPIPEPEPREIRVKVRASGFNPSDFQRAGYQLPGAPYPFVLGIDVAGVIDAIGLDARRCEIDDRVAVHNDISRRGGFEEYAVVDARATAIIPDNVSFTSAAAVPSAGLIAYQAIYRKLQVTSSDTVLITGTGGDVGGFAAQLAASRGAHVIGSASGKHEDRVRSLGAHEFIDYRTTDVGDRVREITDGQGVDAVLDVVGPIQRLKSFSSWRLLAGLRRRRATLISAQ